MQQSHGAFMLCFDYGLIWFHHELLLFVFANHLMFAPGCFRLLVLSLLAYWCLHPCALIFKRWLALAFFASDVDCLPWFALVCWRFPLRVCVWVSLATAHVRLLSVAVARLRLPICVDVCCWATSSMQHSGNTWKNQVVTITWRIHICVFQLQFHVFCLMRCCSTWLRCVSICFCLLPFVMFVYVCFCFACSHFLSFARVCCLPLFATVCYCLLAFACACLRLFAFVCVCMRLHAFACVCLRLLAFACVCFRLLSFAFVCFRLLSCSCWRMRHLIVTTWLTLRDFRNSTSNPLPTKTNGSTQHQTETQGSQWNKQ